MVLCKKVYLVLLLWITALENVNALAVDIALLGGVDNTVLFGSTVQLLCMLSEDRQQPIVWHIGSQVYYPDSEFPDGHAIIYHDKNRSKIEISSFEEHHNFTSYKCFVQVTPIYRTESETLVLTGIYEAATVSVTDVLHEQASTQLHTTSSTAMTSSHSPAPTSVATTQTLPLPSTSPVPSVTLPEDNAAMCTFNVVNTLIILTLNIACVLYLYK